MVTFAQYVDFLTSVGRGDYTIWRARDEFSDIEAFLAFAAQSEAEAAIPAEARAFVAEGKKIHAIKAYRTAHQSSLLEAKNVIEAYAATLPVDPFKAYARPVVPPLAAWEVELLDSHHEEPPF